MNYKQLEEARSVLIALGGIIAIGAYFKIIANAFNRGPLWGIFTVFCPPFGGWLHCFGTWWDTSKIFIAHAVGLAMAVGCFLYFPQPQIYGYWTSESGDVVWRFDQDGTLRDLGIQPDGKFSYRGIKLVTRELPVRSPLRLALSKQSEFHVGYHDPKTGSLMLYHEMKDPEIFPQLASSGLELRRVPNPEGPEFKTKLARLAVRESIYDAATRLLASDGAPLETVISESVFQRYERALALARTATVAELEKLSSIEQVHALRLRAVYAKEIAAGATAAALVANDLKERTYFMIPAGQTLVYDAQAEAGGKTGMAVLAASRRDDFVSRSYTAQPNAKGQWTFDMLASREQDIERGTARFKTGGLAGAFSYLNFRFQITEHPELLKPLAR